MSQKPILEIKRDQAPKITANLLPCRIHYTGPVDPVTAYWSPETKDDTNTAYFRGRKLTGKALALPEGYRGVVLKQDESKKSEREVEIEEDEGEGPETRQMEVMAQFDEMVVWGHGEVPDATDPYLRGVDEWLQVASKIHVDETPEAAE